MAYAEGEDERVLRAVQIVVDEGLARPTLVGRPAVIAQRIERFGLRLKPGATTRSINPEDDQRYRDFWPTYHELTERKGVSQPFAKIEMRRRLTLIGAMLLHKGEVDGMICGTWGTHALHLHYIDQVIGRRAGCQHLRRMNGWCCSGAQGVHRGHLRQSGSDRRADGRDHGDGAEEMRRFGITPKAALLSHSNFGTSD